MSSPKKAATGTSTTSQPDSSWKEIDLDDMTGEIARTLLACEDLSGPNTESAEEDGDDVTSGGIPSWLM